MIVNVFMLTTFCNVLSIRFHNFLSGHLYYSIQLFFHVLPPSSTLNRYPLWHIAFKKKKSSWKQSNINVSQHSIDYAKSFMIGFLQKRSFYFLPCFFKSLLTNQSNFFGFHTFSSTCVQIFK